MLNSFFFFSYSSNRDKKKMNKTKYSESTEDQNLSLRLRPLGHPDLARTISVENILVSKIIKHWLLIRTAFAAT